MPAKTVLTGLFAGVLLLPLGLQWFSHLFAGVQYEQARWVGEIVQAKRADAMRVHAPRIVILAGSNGLFNVSARLIEDEFGMHAVNLSTHAGLGRRYILDFGARLVQAGDLFVLPLEYELYGTSMHDSTELLQALVYDRPHYDEASLGEKLVLLGSFSPFEWWSLTSAVVFPQARRSDGYDARTLDDLGDETLNAASPRRFRPHHNVTPHVVDPTAFDDLKRFADRVRRAGAEVVLAYPSVHVDAYRTQVTPAFLDELNRRAEAAGLRYIGRAEDNAFPTSWWFDTRYHQTREGQVATTHRLLRDLKSAQVTLPPPRLPSGVAVRP